MKVVHSKTPTEEVKIENLFGDEYAPEEYEFICDDCLAEEVDSLKEDVVWLAEDIIDLDSWLGILWEKIQAIEDEQVQDVENLSSTIEVLWCLQKANKMMLDLIIEQDKEIKNLNSEHRILDNVWWKTSLVTFIWLVILTWWMVYNVFK